MNKIAKTSRHALNLRPLVAGGLLALFVFVLALAQIRTLHELCHAEAAERDHQCVFTLVKSGLVDAPPAQVLVTPPVALEPGAAFAITSFVASVDSSLLPSRGPPALLA